MTLSQYMRVLDEIAARQLAGPMLLHFDYGQTFTGYPVVPPIDNGLVVFCNRDLSGAPPAERAQSATYRFISLGAIVSVEMVV